METGPRPYDANRLEAYLKVLAYASRIELLGLLREPHTLDEIRLEPGPSKAGDRPERPISRQAVAYHLDQLVKAGLVRSSLAERQGRKTLHEFSVDQASLYALVEEFRKVSTIGSSLPQQPKETVALLDQRREPWEPGPKLILVHGVYEGKAYPLRETRTSRGRGWIIGRKSDVPVPLTYDPYVSLENSEVVRTRNGYDLLDLRTARNGTHLNWERLPLGANVPLLSGDVIGVGRSMLLFRDR